MFFSTVIYKHPKGLPRYPSTVTLPDASTPLRLALAWLVVCATPMAENGQPRGYYSSTFVAGILDIVAREAFEVNPTPATFTTLQTETDRLVRRECLSIGRMIARRRERGQAVPADLEAAAASDKWMDRFKDNFRDMNAACVFIDTIEREIRNRINEQEEELDGTEPIERRSPLGLYFRKLLIILRKVSFDETHILAAQVGEWCGQTVASRTGVPLAWTFNRERIESTGLKETGVALAKYRSALSSGDYAEAMFSLRRFYDLQLNEFERPMHQHALLNIATFHYNTGGLESALAAINNAVRHARKVGDSQCLHKCTQLQYRIKVELESGAWPGFQVPLVKDQRLPLRTLQENRFATDELWSIKAAVDLGEPVHVAFRRVYTALSYHYTSVTHDGADKPDNKDKPEQLPVPPLSPAAWHGVQAALWNMIGSDTLAGMHEDMAFTSPDLEDELRIEVVIARADRLCEQGRVDDALALMLDSSTIDGMALSEYRRWASAVWSLLERSAVLDGDGDALSVIAGLRGSTALLRVGPGGPVREAFDPAAPPTSSAKGIIFAHGEVTSALRRAEKLLAAHAPAHLVLPDVLSALQLASALALWPLYAHATLAFADALLAMNLPYKADEEVARVWEQLGAVDVARGALIRAKAYAAMAMDVDEKDDDEEEDEKDGKEAPSPAALMAQAARYADLALERAGPLRMRGVHNDARVLRSMLADVAGLPFPRDKAAEMPPPNGTERARRVGEVVRLVGIRVSEGWK